MGKTKAYAKGTVMVTPFLEKLMGSTMVLTVFVASGAVVADQWVLALTALPGMVGLIVAIIYYARRRRDHGRERERRL